MYYSDNNIKYIDSIIKCIGFESFHYAINPNVISFFMVFSDFYSIDEIIFLFKKKKMKLVFNYIFV